MSGSFWDVFVASRSGSAGQAEAIVGQPAGVPGVYIGADGSGSVSVVVECVPPAHALAAFDLTGVRARFDVLLDLNIGGVVRQARCSVLQCLVGDEGVQRLFLATIESLLNTASERRSTEWVHEQFETVVWMFSRLTAPAASSITGLLGELAVVAFHSDPIAAAHAWRSNTTSRFDFTFAGHRLEVKSTTTRTRSHAVSYEQVNPPAGATTYMASVWVEEAAQGISGAELLDATVGSCVSDDDAVLRVRDVVVSTMGSDLQAFLDFRCDEAVLRDEMLFYDAREVPAFRHLPPGVAGATFLSDFSFADPISLPARL